MTNGKLLDISWATLFKIGVATLAFYLVYLIRDILILTLFALVISVLFIPAIDFLQKRGVARLLATIFVFTVIFGLLGFLVYLISLAFISEIKQISNVLPQYFEVISPPLRGLGLDAFENIEAFFAALEVWVKEASANILSAIFIVFGGLFAGLFIFFLSFFLALEEKGVERAIKTIFPQKYENLAQNIWLKSQQKITGWFGARILLCALVGLATFITLKIFDVDYSLSLGLFAGITNIIPFLGPFLAGAVITLMILVEDWLKAVFVLIVFILIQQIEGNILTPLLMKRVTGLSPALVLISLIVGAQLFGFLGMILAIPLVGILFDFLGEFLKRKESRQATV